MVQFEGMVSIEMVLTALLQQLLYLFSSRITHKTSSLLSVGKSPIKLTGGSVFTKSHTVAADKCNNVKLIV